LSIKIKDTFFVLKIFIFIHLLYTETVSELLVTIITEGIFMAHAITKKNYTQEIINAPMPVILDVYAPWCGPCQFMKPIFEQLEKELNTKIIFATLNVEEDRELSIELGISSIPAFIFFNQGSLVAKEVGSMSHDEFITKIKKHFNI